MKKKALVLAAVFVLFFSAGLAYNQQQGLYCWDTFWRIDKEGVYHSPSGDTVRARSGSEVEMVLSGKRLTATLEKGADQVDRICFSDGWAVEALHKPHLTVEIGGVLLMHGAAYTLTDPEAAGLRFAPVFQTEITPFHDENGHKVGETITLLDKHGTVLDYQERWYGQPPLSTPEKERFVLHSGARFNSDDAAHMLFVNDAGEYLLEPERLTLVQTGDGWRSRAALFDLLLSAAQGAREPRGHAYVLLLYVILYAMGALSFLWPEQAAFFGTRWKYQTEPELSDTGLLAMQAGSVLTMLLAAVLLFLPLF